MEKSIIYGAIRHASQYSKLISRFDELRQSGECLPLLVDGVSEGASYSLLHSLPHFKECVVSFNHVFDRSLSTKRIRDYDNLECKQLLDTVSGFLLLDDGGLFCDVYHTTSLGQSDYTILTIMEKDAFPNWLSGQKNTPKTVSDFS